MLEWKKSLDGYEVPIIQGQSLGSLRAHRAEAEKWVERVSELCSQSDLIVVLGLGSGTHIQTLKEKFASEKIIVFDFFPEVLGPIRAKNQYPIGTSIFFLNEVEDVFETSVISEIFAQRPPVLLFGPVRLVANRLYEDLQMTLTARNPAGRARFSDWLAKNSHAEKESVWETLGELLK
ncbi:MAG: hypothetical protein AB7O96_06610 [Pseudobdellovibrionaceae bacterium]